MKTIHVTASRSYDVTLGPGVLARAGEVLRELRPGAGIAAVVSDDTVFPLHGEALCASLRSAGFDAPTRIVPHGEETKNANTLVEVLDFLARSRVTRADAVIALGGGMVGDLTGLAAAVYMRGIPYIQCPTTLLAAVDSSVGGKTAVDLPAGKNLMGAFWQPLAVLCGLDTLSTLPADIFADGCAEVIKTAILFDPALFFRLSRETFDISWEEVIARCVECKRDIVAEDEFDTGRRGLLNLGHTLGHAVEARSGFAVSHGRAVSIGTAVVTRAAAAAGLCDASLPGQVEDILRRFGLPTSTDYTMEELMPYLLSDKKRAGDKVTLVVPEALGRCTLRPLDAAAACAFLEAGL